MTSLFDDSQNKARASGCLVAVPQVVNALLVPGELKPEDIQRMQQLEYWSSQKDMMDWKNITEGCPRGFVSAEPSRPPANAAPAGSYWEQVDWTDARSISDCQHGPRAHSNAELRSTKRLALTRRRCRSCPRIASF